MDVYEASFQSLLFKDEWEFTKYVKGQKQMRYDLEQQVGQVEEVVKQLDNPPSKKSDGNWLNVAR